MAVVKLLNGSTPKFKPMTEAGVEGLNAFYGHVSETYISNLEWPQAYGVYNEMRRRDPTLRSILNAGRLLARQATITAEPASDSAADKQAAEWLEAVLDSMTHTVDDFIDDVFTFLPFGWSSFEMVYRRNEDGTIGWDKLAFRRQSSFERWEFSDKGDMLGWWQIAAPNYKETLLPAGKTLHFVAERDGNNPEGLCMFESAYEMWHFVKNLQIISGIGWQRTFVGLPVFKFEFEPSANDKAAVEAMGQGLTIDEKQYASLPPGVDMDLKSTTNTGAQSLLDTIRMYRIFMAQIILADFFFLGSTDSGSRALGADKSELFIMAINGLMEKIVQAWNRQGVKRLYDFEANKIPGMTDYPRLKAKEITKPNLPELADFLQKISPLITLGDEDQIWIRDQANMPMVEPNTEDKPAMEDNQPADDNTNEPQSPDDEMDAEGHAQIISQVLRDLREPNGDTISA